VNIASQNHPTHLELCFRRHWTYTSSRQPSGHWDGWCDPASFWSPQHAYSSWGFHLGL